MAISTCALLGGQESDVSARDMICAHNLGRRGGVCPLLSRNSVNVNQEPDGARNNNRNLITRHSLP